MRTTLNLDDDVVAQLTERSRQEGRSVSRVINDLVRSGLREASESQRLEAYEPPVLETGRPLIDVTDVAATLDLLDDGR